MKWMLLALMTVVLAACSGESSPERKARLEKASTEAERIECNKESAIEADKKQKTPSPKKTIIKAAASGLPAAEVLAVVQQIALPQLGLPQSGWAI